MFSSTAKYMRARMAPSGAAPRPWADGEVLTLRARLKLGESLLEISHRLDRSPEEIAGKIAEGAPAAADSHGAAIDDTSTAPEGLPTDR
jgi:hypothetical protein